MRIAVEEAVLEDHLRSHLRRPCHESPAVDAGVVERGEIADLDPA